MAKVGEYKRLSIGAVHYIGVLGGLVRMFNTDLNWVKEKSIYNIDLDICGKLSRKLISKELDCMQMIDWIRV